MTDVTAPFDDQVEPVVDDNFDYAHMLRYSQTFRKRIVAKLAGDRIPNDPKEIDMLLKTLKDMDQTTLNERKNQIDQGAADSSKEVAEAMHQLLQMQMNKNPFQRKADGSAPDALPKLDVEKLGHHEVVAGETEIGVVVESSADFMARMEAKRQLEGDDDD